LSVRQQYHREYGKGLPHKKTIASETDARKMNSSARLGGLKEAPASIGGEYFTRKFYYQYKRMYCDAVNEKMICHENVFKIVVDTLKSIQTQYKQQQIEQIFLVCLHSAENISKNAFFDFILVWVYNAFLWITSFQFTNG